MSAISKSPPILIPNRVLFFISVQLLTERSFLISFCANLYTIRKNVRIVFLKFGKTCNMLSKISEKRAKFSFKTQKNVLNYSYLLKGRLFV